MRAKSMEPLKGMKRKGIEKVNLTTEAMLQDSAFLKFLGTCPNMAIGEAYRKYEDMNNQKYIDMHLKTRAISQHADGFWHTRWTEQDGRVTHVKKKNYRDLCAAIIAHYKEGEETPIVSRVFYQMADERLNYNEIQRGTFDRLNNDFNRFFVSYGMDKKIITNITDDELTDFIKYCISNYQLSSKAWANLKGLLIMIFTYAKAKHYTTFSISAFLGDLNLPRNIFKKKVIDESSQVFTDEEMHKIEDWIRATDERLHTASNLGILLAFYTGVRAGELSTLKHEDFVGNRMIVRRTEVRSKNRDTHEYEFMVRELTKGRDGIREVFLPEEALKIVKMIKEINPDGEYLFMEKGQRKKGDRFSEKLKRICKYVGIPPRSLHKLRKTYASILLDSGCTEKLILSQMGHTDILTTKNYYYRNRKNDEEKSRSINSAFSEYRSKDNNYR